MAPGTYPYTIGCYYLNVKCQALPQALQKQVHLFSYGPKITAEIESALSADRLSSYVSATGSLEDAIQLYCWNTAVSAAFFGPIGILEVTLRNAVNERLSKTFDTAWYKDATFLAIDPVFTRKLDQAERGITKFSKAVTVPRMVAELSFGFWVNLFRPKYVRTLWGPALARAFPTSTTRSKVEGYLEPLLRFRNRVAHHEPIHQQNLTEQYERLLAVVELIEPTLVPWLAYHSRVPTLIARRKVVNF